MFVEEFLKWHLSNLFPIIYSQLELVAVANEFRRIHPFDRGWQCGHVPWSFGTHSIADAVLAASEICQEEAHAVIAEFAISRQTFEDIPLRWSSGSNPLGL